MPPDLDSARSRFAALAARLRERGLAFRAPPPEPTTCCGRGCNGCVWEGWYAAAAWWCEDALALLSASAAPAGESGVGGDEAVAGAADRALQGLSR